MEPLQNKVHLLVILFHAQLKMHLLSTFGRKASSRPWLLGRSVSKLREDDYIRTEIPHPSISRSCLGPTFVIFKTCLARRNIRILIGSRLKRRHRQRRPKALIHRETLGHATSLSHSQHLGQLGVGQLHDFLGALVLVAELAKEVADNHGQRNLGTRTEASAALQHAVFHCHVRAQAKRGAERHRTLEKRFDVAFAQYSQLVPAELVVRLWFGWVMEIVGGQSPYGRLWDYDITSGC